MIEFESMAFRNDESWGQSSHGGYWVVALAGGPDGWWLGWLESETTKQCINETMDQSILNQGDR